MQTDDHADDDDDEDTMSDQMPPTGGMPGAGTAGAGMPGQPSDEEMRAAIGQMRAAPVDQILAEVLQALVSGAQVKLGRNDGRLLLDLLAVVTEGTRGQVADDLTQQLDDVLGQLRMAQVQAEQEIVQAATEGHVEQNDLPRRPAPLRLAERPAPAEGEQAAQAQSGDEADASGEADAPQQRQQPAPGSSASRLWVPGR